MSDVCDDDTGVSYLSEELYFIFYFYPGILIFFLKSKISPVRDSWLSLPTTALPRDRTCVLPTTMLLRDRVCVLTLVGI